MREVGDRRGDAIKDTIYQHHFVLSALRNSCTSRPRETFFAKSVNALRTKRVGGEKGKAEREAVVSGGYP